MAGNGGLSSRIFFHIVTGCVLYISAYMLIGSIVKEDGSLVGAIILISLIWWVYSRALGLLRFAFSNDEISYEEYKSNMRQLGYKVIEEDMPLANQVLGRASREVSRGTAPDSRSENNSGRRAGGNPQPRIRIGSEGQHEDEIMRDIADMFRAT